MLDWIHLQPAPAMGLFLNYELQLPASCSHEHVTASLQQLRAFATTQPFANVSPFLSSAIRLSTRDRQRLGALQYIASIMTEPYRDESHSLTADGSSALGFLVNPGKGCETATFGFLRRANDAGDHVDWYWRCFCKTQYASVVSDHHLIACHTSLVHVLDHAITLGIQVDVYDETHYWETRDTSELVREVHAMNRLVAAFAGTLSDAMGPAHRVQAPIFEHRRFERLEMGDDE